MLSRPAHPQTAPAARPPDPIWLNGRRGVAWAAGLLLGIVLLAHGGSIDDGLFFDDYWHRDRLRELGWSFDDQIESATFNLPGRLVHLWWQEQPLEFRYARPLAMLLMKLEFLASGGDPRVVHGFALAWHWATSLLVFALAVWALRQRTWALLAAALFAIEPQSVFAVSWTAARNALVSVPFFLAALLAYIRATNTTPPEPVRDGAAARPLMRGGRRWLWLAATLVCWAAALFCRETAIAFPLLLPLVDAACGGWSRVRARLWLHASFLLLGGAYLYWRLVLFPTSTPPPIYYTPLSEIGGAAWPLVKMLHMLFVMFIHTPMLKGLATNEGIRAGESLAYLLMALGLLLIAGAYFLAARRLPTRWLWPIWLVAALAPVLPVFLMPHFAYLPAVAASIAMVVVARGLPRRSGRLLACLLLLFSGWSLVLYRYVWRGIVRSEQLLYADVLEHTNPPGPGARVFLINWPIAGIYAAVAQREAWGLADLEAHVLTFAPHPLIMDQPCVVEALNDYELLVTTPAPGYFAGESGRMLLDGTRPADPLAAGEVVPGEFFDTTIVERDAEGITRLRFSFHEPLASPWNYFYVSTAGRPAQRLRFDERPAVLSARTRAAFAAMRSDARTGRARARRDFVQRAAPIAEQLCDPMQETLTRIGALEDDAIAELEQWWRRIDGDRLVQENEAWRDRYAGWLREQNRYFQIMSVVASLVRSDVYLTGNAPREP